MAFTWTEPKRRAVVLLAEDLHTDAEIAEQCGVTRQGLAKWKTSPEFHTAVQDAVDAFAKRILRYRIARREERIAAKNERWESLQQIARDRKQKPLVTVTGDPVPGGATGWLVEEKTFSKKGVTIAYVASTDISSECRALEKEASQEMGQWLERRDVTSGGKGLQEILRDVLTAPVVIDVAEETNPFHAAD